jgi:phage regulator Rha-like protein
MTSLEIAELVGSEHPKVRQSIERLAQRTVIQLPPMVKVENKQSLSPNNKTSVYVFYGNVLRDVKVLIEQLYGVSVDDSSLSHAEIQVVIKFPATREISTATKPATVLTFSSRLGDDEKGKRHDNVKTSIKTLAKQGVIQLPATQEVKNYQSLSPNAMSKVYVFSSRLGDGKQHKNVTRDIKELIHQPFPVTKVVIEVVSVP